MSEETPSLSQASLTGQAAIENNKDKALVLPSMHSNAATNLGRRRGDTQNNTGYEPRVEDDEDVPNEPMSHLERIAYQNLEGVKGLYEQGVVFEFIKALLVFLSHFDIKYKKDDFRKKYQRNQPLEHELALYTGQGISTKTLNSKAFENKHTKAQVLAMMKDILV
ncbi:hypothetical protein GQ43DRAFT_486117 [Delitschia confertaspora ATCC 74209]|uniref:Uncharacterized protein n=1 Tax=Delitschia confertaspora ATCC 74209 TaxID=1513339 RepID=A0A9P4MWA5_9PLEO|nr:hypothetical protein GQ43DRAFT_486117 [Delitschia confertaspora ATCC 74209]